MFWRRTTGDGAFVGLFAGTLAAALHYELTVVAGGALLIGKLADLHTYPSHMAQNFRGDLGAPGYAGPAAIGIVVLALTLVRNVVFW